MTREPRRLKPLGILRKTSQRKSRFLWRRAASSRLRGARCIGDSQRRTRQERFTEWMFRRCNSRQHSQVVLASWINRGIAIPPSMYWTLSRGTRVQIGTRITSWRRSLQSRPKPISPEQRLQTRRWRTRFQDQTFATHSCLHSLLSSWIRPRRSRCSTVWFLNTNWRCRHLSRKCTGTSPPTRSSHRTPRLLLRRPRSTERLRSRMRTSSWLLGASHKPRWRPPWCCRRASRGLKDLAHMKTSNH